MALPEASSGPQACASTGSDRHKDRGASAEAAKSQDNRGLALTLESETLLGAISISRLSGSSPLHSKVLVRFVKSLRLVFSKSNCNYSHRDIRFCIIHGRLCSEPQQKRV